MTKQALWYTSNPFNLLQDMLGTKSSNPNEVFLALTSPVLLIRCYTYMLETSAHN